MSQTKNAVINTHILPGCYRTKLVPEIKKKLHTQIPCIFWSKCRRQTKC